MQLAVTALQNSKANNTQLITRPFAQTDSVISLPSLNYVTLETVNLSNYGSGKAIITFYVNSDVFYLSTLTLRIKESANNFMEDRQTFQNTSTTHAYLKGCATLITNYDSNTKIDFMIEADPGAGVEFKPKYSYQILLLPNN